jgi:hypothetical protein
MKFGLQKGKKLLPGIWTRKRASKEMENMKFNYLCAWKIETPSNA